MKYKPGLSRHIVFTQNCEIRKPGPNLECDKMNSSGKVLTIFLVITAVLLLTLTGAATFYWTTEIEKRKTAEIDSEKNKSELSKIQVELEDVKKQKFVLEEKYKEADERINSLLDDLELEKGLREEMKKEAVSLKENMEKEIKNKEKIREELNKKIEEANETISGLEVKLKEQETRWNEQEEKKKEDVELLNSLKERNRLLEEENLQLSQGMGITGYKPGQGLQTDGKDNSGAEDMSGENSQSSLEKPAEVEPGTLSEEEENDISLRNKIESTGVELDAIVVKPGDEQLSEGDAAQISAVPSEIPEGRVLSVDTETEFVIVNLGKKHGVTIGRVMSVYRGDQYLGDVKVTRIQPEMAAADLILPLTAKMVRKNDQVLVK